MMSCVFFETWYQDVFCLFSPNVNVKNKQTSDKEKKANMMENTTIKCQKRSHRMCQGNQINNGDIECRKYC